MKKAINYIIKAIGALYYVTIGKLFWKSSTLLVYKKTGKITACRVCGWGLSEYCCSIPIVGELSLFDKRGFAQSIYSLSFVPGTHVRTILKTMQKFAFWPNSVYMDYYRCRKCGCYFQNTPIDYAESLAYYSRSFRAGRKFGRPEIYTPGGRFYLWADYLKKWANLSVNAKVLDVGCAEGYLVYRLKEMGFQAYGSELSEAMVRYGREDLRLENLIVGDYDIRCYDKKYFDLITSYHVLEHMADHKMFFQAVSAHLKIGGYLILSTPSGESGYAQYKCNNCVKDVQNVFTDSHFVLFTFSYLSGLLREHGFTIVAKQLIDKTELLYHNKEIADSGEKWLGMNIIARKSG